MTDKNLRETINEFISIAKDCPDNLQTICFELLLKNHLTNNNNLSTKQDDAKENEPKENNKSSSSNLDTKSQEDIQLCNIHVKAKKFLEKYSISINDLNQLFYLENDQIQPLFDDLGTTKISECQIRLTLLGTLINALKSGNFVADIEAIRAECNTRKCYDSNNFAQNYKNNKELFTEEYNKKIKELTLTEEGKKHLAEIINQIK